MYRYKNHTEEQIEKIKEAAEIMLHNPCMTQEELGELFGVNPRTVRAWVKSYERIDMTGYKKIKDNFKEHMGVGKSLDTDMTTTGCGKLKRRGRRQRMIDNRGSIVVENW